MPLLAAAALLSAAPAYAQTPATPKPSTSSGAGASGSANSATPGAEASTPPVAVDANFQLGYGDSVSIEAVGAKDFSVKTQVSSEGAVVLPLIGKVNALGLTTAQLTKAIEDELKKGGYYANPIIRVDVTGVSSRYATVLGDVPNPGLLPLDRTYHLSDIVARVGARAGEGAGTIVLTPANGQPKRYSVEELATGAGPGDPLVQPGDKIYVPAPGSEVVYISGQVRAPGAFPVIRNMTVRDAIARGGGLTPMGAENKLKLFRKNVEVKDVKLDTPLQAGDILKIGERLF